MNTLVPGVSVCVRNGKTSSEDMVPVTRTHTKSLSYICMHVQTHTHSHTHTHAHTHTHEQIHTYMHLRIHVCML